MTNIFHKLGDFFEDYGDVIMFVFTLALSIGLYALAFAFSGALGWVFIVAALIIFLYPSNVIFDIFEMRMWAKAINARDAQEAE